MKVCVPFGPCGLTEPFLDPGTLEAATTCKSRVASTISKLLDFCLLKYAPNKIIKHSTTTSKIRFTPLRAIDLLFSSLLPLVLALLVGANVRGVAGGNWDLGKEGGMLIELVGIDGTPRSTKFSKTMTRGSANALVQAVAAACISALPSGPGLIVVSLTKIQSGPIPEKISSCETLARDTEGEGSIKSISCDLRETSYARFSPTDGCSRRPGRKHSVKFIDGQLRHPVGSNTVVTVVVAVDVAVVVAVDVPEVVAVDVKVVLSVGAKLG